MAQASNANAHHPDSPEHVAEMAKFGITRKSVDYFYHEEYRYTSFREALAQAKRVAVET